MFLDTNIGFQLDDIPRNKTTGFHNFRELHWLFMWSNSLSLQLKGDKCIKGLKKACGFFPKLRKCETWFDFTGLWNFPLKNQWRPLLWTYISTMLLKYFKNKYLLKEMSMWQIKNYYTYVENVMPFIIFIQKKKQYAVITIHSMGIIYLCSFGNNQFK